MVVAYLLARRSPCAPPRVNPSEVALQSCACPVVFAPNATSVPFHLEYPVGLAFEEGAALQLLVTPCSAVCETIDDSICKLCHLVDGCVVEPRIGRAVVLCRQPQASKIDLGVFCFDAGEAKQIVLVRVGRQVLRAHLVFHAAVDQSSSKQVVLAAGSIEMLFDGVARAAVFDAIAT